jgi:hypothetical protein
VEINFPQATFQSIQSGISDIEAKIVKIENKLGIDKFKNVLEGILGLNAPEGQGFADNINVNDLKYMSLSSQALSGLFDNTDNTDITNMFNTDKEGIFGENTVDADNNILEKTLLGIQDFSQNLMTGIRDTELFSGINSMVDEISAKYGVDAKLIKSVIKAESNYNPKATSHAGAMGLMQLMPQTAQSLGVTNPYDIFQNLDGGTRLLKTLLNSFGGSTELALAAYNAGSKRVIDAGGVPPIPETQNYVKQVLSMYES